MNVARLPRVQTTRPPASPQRLSAAQKMLASRKAPLIRRAPTLPMPSELLDARQSPDVSTVPARTVLAIEGAGAPDGAPYAGGLLALTGIAYSLKFARKNGGGTPFKIGPLEARWWAAV